MGGIPPNEMHDPHLKTLGSCICLLNTADHYSACMRKIGPFRINLNSGSFADRSLSLSIQRC